MQRADKRQAIIVGIGGIAAIMAALIGLLVGDVPNHLRSLVSSPTAWAIVMTCTLPILVILFTNQVSLLLKAASDREDTVRDILKFLPAASLIIAFSTSAEAMHYLIENVRRARHIFNTRLATKEIEQSDPSNVHLTNRLDEQILKAVHAGANYDLIVSADHRPSAHSMLARRQALAQKSRNVGICSCWTLENSRLPLFHFCILEYDDYREMLIGWALTSSRSFGNKVFLVRDTRFVEYCKEIFESYVHVSQTISIPGWQEHSRF